MDSYNKEKDINNVKKAASELVVMMSGKREETSNAKEELVCNKIYDAKNCKAVAKQTNNNIEHDRNSIVDTNKGEKEEVDINDEGGREWTMNLTLTAFTTMNMTTQTLMVLLMVLIME
jgi:hypothetical protein